MQHRWNALLYSDKESVLLRVHIGPVSVERAGERVMSMVVPNNWLSTVKDLELWLQVCAFVARPLLVPADSRRFCAYVSNLKYLYRYTATTHNVQPASAMVGILACFGGKNLRAN